MIHPSEAIVLQPNQSVPKKRPTWGYFSHPRPALSDTTHPRDVVDWDADRSPWV